MKLIEPLPEHLGERTRVLGDEPLELKSGASYVLYWMRTAVRADENPALDVATWIADQQGLPLLVYHAISEHYEYASDRHHTFILQGARDVQQQFAEQGISYAFHLATPTDRQPHLASLADKAAVVVTEDMPVDPPRRFVQALQQKSSTPIAVVDTACVAPMKLVKKAHTRAFAYRSATKELYAERLTRGWPTSDISPKSFDCSTLPFEPLDLQSADLAELVAGCQIDHAVGPVVDTVGGSRAGYSRWRQFKEKHLNGYAKQRNNALRDGVSRMSAYLHYGMVSPFRIAREAADINNAGAEKYLDELLIWRELAYAFCFYRDDHDQWSAIPEWARETLEQHASDQRKVYSWEQLARGKTDDAFWNAAQHSLLKQGELHNNVRMTWGKAILNWTKDPQTALSTIIDLNHRYALDGRDPASYGGILWCLGQFDRPFEPDQNIIGTVRSRPTSNHASRLDLEQYQTKVNQPRFDPVPNVAVIGAGISGLIAARTLQDHGIPVTVFDKGRGVGGRMSARRTDAGGSFDHGAQYFTARDPRFARYVDSWGQQGLVDRWPDQAIHSDQKIVVIEAGSIQSESSSQDRFVAVPAMNAICKHLASDLTVRLSTRIDKITAVDDGVALVDQDGNDLGVFDRLIVSAPAAQTAELLVDFPAVAKPVADIKMKACWAAMVSFDKPITDQWVGAFLHESFLSWSARNSSKPGRDHDQENVIIHATPEWTAEHWEDDPDEVAQAMLQEFWRVTGLEALESTHLQVHRWKYAIAETDASVGCFTNESAVVIACGDWANGSRVEGAFLSGMAAAGRITGTLTPMPNSSAAQSLLFE